MEKIDENQKGQRNSRENGYRQTKEVHERIKKEHDELGGPEEGLIRGVKPRRLHQDICDRLGTDGRVQKIL